MKPYCPEVHKRYNRSAKGKARRARYKRTAKYRAALKRRYRTATARATTKRYRSKPEVREHYNWMHRSFRKKLKLQEGAL